MCLILTVVMLVLSIQNLYAQQWLAGGIQLFIALFFLVLLVRNIRITQCRRDENCTDFCILPDRLKKLFSKKE